MASSSSSDLPLLLVDAGNTSLTLGLWRRGKILQSFRLSSQLRDLASLEQALHQALAERSLQYLAWQGAVFCSVVAPLRPLLQEILTRLCGSCLQIHSGHFPWLRLDTDPAWPVGIDRLVNCYGAHRLYPENLLVVDLGSATTLDLVTAQGVFLGGAIAPGLAMSLKALHQFTDQLPQVELAAPPQPLGKNTPQAIQSGVILGHAAMIDGLIQKMESYLHSSLRVLATGGLAPLLMTHSQRMHHLEPDLTLISLGLLFQEEQG